MPSLNIAEFFDGLGLVSVTARLDKNRSDDENGAGVLNRASYGTRLWSGSVTIRLDTHENLEPVLAKIQYLEEADVSFRLYPGWRFGAPLSAGTVDAIGTDRREVTLSKARDDGDIFGITFSSTKRSMHRVVSRSGLVHTVVPALPAGVVATDATSFGRPEIDAVLTSFTDATFRSVVADGPSFNWKQTY